MPRVKSSPPVDANGKRVDDRLMYVCRTSGSVEIAGQELEFRQGLRLRGDDERVQALPGYFAQDGDPLPTHFDDIVRRHDAEQPAPDYELSLSGGVPEVLEAVDIIRLTRDVTVRCGYVADRQVVQFERGDCFNARSELASVLPPDSFEAVKGREIVKARGR
jgi:hypothetical protein